MKRGREREERGGVCVCGERGGGGLTQLCLPAATVVF